ncbi:UvrD-helicase domain-containing protein [Streptomyces sp. NPDC057107]|uniref:UvrD-helicase domain-containing protein n=1 Tax=Streptomyces sp. NPDC057107 TaxID=3346021 RepID=UPI003634CB1A
MTGPTSVLPGSAPILVPPTLAPSSPSFTPDQRKAATHAGNLMVLAGPGAGKTRTLVARIGVSAKSCPVNDLQWVGPVQPQTIGAS